MFWVPSRSDQVPLPFRLLCLCHSVCIYNRTSCAQVHELQQSHCGDNRESTLFSWLYGYCAYLAYLRFELSVCRGCSRSLVINNTYIYIYNIYIYIYIYILVLYFVYCVYSIFSSILYTLKIEDCDNAHETITSYNLFVVYSSTIYHHLLMYIYVYIYIYIYIDR